MLGLSFKQDTCIVSPPLLRARGKQRGVVSPPSLRAHGKRRGVKPGAAARHSQLARDHTEFQHPEKNFIAGSKLIVCFIQKTQNINQKGLAANHSRC